MRTQEAYTISILDCAKKLGLKFSRTWVNGDGLTEHVFHTPQRKDKNPSIYINEAKNVWYDNGGSIEGGGIIQFINYFYGNPSTDTRSALKILDTVYPDLKYASKNNDNTSVFLQKNLNFTNYYNKKSPTFEVLEVKTLFSYPLKNYLEKERKLNLSICQQHVKEIVYRYLKKDIQFYGIGFKSGKTWAIRRNGFKGFIGKGVDITVFDCQTDKVFLFEGFIDYLSYLTIKKINNPLTTCVILNSVVQLKKFFSFLDENPHIKKIDYFRDRDEAGLSTLNQLKQYSNKTISDRSEFYPDHKDLNEWLVQHSKA